MTKEWVGEEPPSPTDEVDIPFAEGVSLPPPVADEGLTPWWEWNDQQHGSTLTAPEKAPATSNGATAAAEAPLAPPPGVKAAVTGGERPRLTLIGDVEPRKIEWLEPELVARGMLTGLLAPGGTGKGLYSIHLSTKIAAREERSLFLCSEDALDYIVRPRFIAAGCDARLVVALDLESESGTRGLRFPSDLDHLKEAIAAYSPGLVVIDPMLSYIDPTFDLAKNNQMRAILQPLIDLARDSGAALLPVYHLGKDRTRGAVGSVAFEDACRAVLTVAKDDEDDDLRHLELTKSNVGPTGYGRKLRIVEVPIDIQGESVQMAKLADEGRSEKSVVRLLERKGAQGPDPQQKATARRALGEMLSAAEGRSLNAGQLKREVAEKVGCAERTVHRAFDELRKEGLVGATPNRDEFGTIKEWLWFGRTELLVGRGDQ